jgi:uncharacterized protein
MRNRLKKEEDQCYYFFSEELVVPNIKECVEMLNQHKVPDNIVQHSRIVYAVALYLCQMLNRNKANLDPLRIGAASLLHDISKAQNLDPGVGHAEAGGRLLLQLGFPEISEIVRQHVVLDDHHVNEQVTEAMLVFYADKRVKHTEVVSLVDRFQDLKDRYGVSPTAVSWLEEHERQTLLVEKRIFQQLPIQPENLNSIPLSAYLPSPESNFSGEFEKP